MTQRDGSRSLRSATVHVPRERRAANKQHFAFGIDNGVYQLRERFVGSKIDRRTTGPGMSTPDGLPKGTRFRIELAPWLEREGRPVVGYREITAPWLLGSTSLATYANGEWYTPIPDDMERLFRLLDRDDSLATWLDVTLGATKYQAGYGDEVLLRLLESGAVTKQQIVNARVEVEAAIDEKERARMGLKPASEITCFDDDEDA